MPSGKLPAESVLRKPEEIQAILSMIETGLRRYREDPMDREAAARLVLINATYLYNDAEARG